jgi:surface-anchored protein
VDHAFRYQGGDWEVVIHGNDEDSDLDPDEAVLVVFDRPFPQEGGRATRPSSEQWNFLGVAGNEDVWLIPQAFTPLIWPGWRSEGAFARYFNGDSRLGFAAPFVKISLEGISYSGLGDGHFSMWSNQTGGVTKLWISSADGLTEEDAYYFSSGHAHTNIGFSDPGVYRVDYTASAFLSNDGGNPLIGTEPVISPVQGFYYAVGTYAEWKATYFAPHELVGETPSDGVPATTAYGSDSDQDGVPLLLEYAFNLSPVEADGNLLTPGSQNGGLPLVYLDDSGVEPRLVIEYLRRREEGAPRLSYYPEFSSTLESGWQEAVSETVVPINPMWEMVRAEDAASSNGDSARFGRVRVELE